MQFKKKTSRLFVSPLRCQKLARDGKQTARLQRTIANHPERLSNVFSLILNTVFITAIFQGLSATFTVSVNTFMALNSLKTGVFFHLKAELLHSDAINYYTGSD